MNSRTTQRFGAVLVRLLVTVLMVLLLEALTALPSQGRDAGAASQASASSPLPRSPLSGSVLAAQALHAGKLHPSSHGTGLTPLPQLPTCSPTPCALPNVQASEGGKPVDEDPIAANPANSQDLLTGGNDFNCSSLLGFYASANGGSTWNRTCMNTPKGEPVGCGDPGVGYDLSGAAYITGIASSSNSCFPGVIIFEKSTDNGQKWSAPAVAVTPLFSGGLTDKPWLQVDDNPSSPHANALYLSVTQFDSSGNDTKISVSHSTNGGTNWTTSAVDTAQVFPAVDQFSDLAIGKDGTVYVSWMRCTASVECAGTQATLLLSKSTDGGSTWSKPVTLATVMLAPDPRGCCFYGQLPNTGERVSEIPVIGIDNSSGPHAGALYAAFYTWTGSSMVVDVASSTTGGSTWGMPVRVTPPGDPNDEFFPWLSVSSSGLVGVTWLDRRYDANNLSYEAFAAISSDGGTTFPNLQIAPVASNPNNDGFNGGFMGDYTGNVWDSTGTILYASWMDSRNGVNMQDEVGGRIGTGSAPAWNVVLSPSAGSLLFGVAAVSASNVWAVGQDGNGQTLTEQWNGTSWSVVKSPNVGTGRNNLTAVAETTATDIWAVGWSQTSSGIQQTLIEQWNGKSWSVVKSPNVGTSSNVLNGVAVVSATDIWAVGNSGNQTQTLIEHWNGTSWKVVSSPNVGTTFNNLNGVAVVSGSDIWAVGFSNSNGSQQALIEHWNGTNWSVINPNVATSFSELNGVAVVSSSDVWAVGDSQVGSSGTQPLTEQWNGTSWNVVSSPTFGTPGNILSAVAVVSASDVWAVGFISSGVQQTLIEQWDGTSWNVVPSIDPGTLTSTFLQGVVAITARNVWAVGYRLNSPPSSAQTLIEQYCC
jgi:hypothetical protein